MKFDDLLVHLGEFGPYQKLQYVLVCLTQISVGIQMVISVFIAAVPPHRCTVPGWSNDTYSVQSQTHQLYINASIPMVVDPLDRQPYSKCQRYVPLDGETMISPDGTFGNSTEQKCSQWVYDKTIFQSSIVTQLDLVCDKKAYRSHAQMIFMGGVLIGSLVFGILADILGRKTCLCIGLTLQVSSGVATAFAPEFYSFCFLRLLNGAANAGLMINSFVYITEMVGPSKRRWTGIPITYFFIIGFIMLPGMAYFIREWKYLQIASTAPFAIFIVYWLILPESPRWLLASGRKEQAKVVLRKMAKRNKVSLTEKMLDDVSLENEKQTESFTKIFKSKVLVFRAAISFFNWMVVSMTYYGLSLNSGNLVGDIYVNFLLSGLVEIPATTLLMLGLNKIGRRPFHSSMMIVGGLACISTLFPVLYADQSLQWVTITLSMIGKFGASAAFCTVYVMTSEIFPTVVRNAAMGGGSMSARVGGMIAPYIADLGDFVGGEMGQAVPLVTFGVSAVLAGGLSLLLPETFNRKLPETIEDGINFGRKKKNASDPEKREKYTYYNDGLVTEENRF